MSSSGAPVGPASRTRGSARPIAYALAIAATASTVVAAWLAFTVATVVRLRDPAHVPLWAGVAAGLLLLAIASFVAVRPGPLAALARAVAATLGVGAAGMGLGVAMRTITHGAPGRFEGYIVIIGLVLAVHGLLALLHAMSAGGAPPPAA